jgi:hypothetical protein
MSVVPPLSLPAVAHADMFANRQATKETGHRAGCTLNGNEQTDSAVVKTSRIRYGRHLATARVTVPARIIDLREEEFRQTGFRSP